jgi:hypothetical protein
LPYADGNANMGKKKDDAFKSSTSTNGSVNDNDESYVEKVFKLPYRIKDVYNTIKDKRKKEKEMYGDY